MYKLIRSKVKALRVKMVHCTDGEKDLVFDEMPAAMELDEP
jgi:hypothetical protein